jgi:hypothetical protein
MKQEEQEDMLKNRRNKIVHKAMKAAKVSQLKNN